VVILRQIEVTSANASWLGEGQSPKAVVKSDWSGPKNMFPICFKTTGVVKFGYMFKRGTPLLLNNI
jgi:hypothetical protein